MPTSLLGQELLRHFQEGGLGRNVLVEAEI